MNTKIKATFIVIAIVLITSVMFAYSVYGVNMRIIESAKRNELKTTATIIQNNLQEQTNKAAARASLICSLPSIKEAFRNQDREQLATRLVPALLEQKEKYGVREAQFHLSPAISFLRVFDLKAGHGEDLSGFREMVLAANRKQEPQMGVEIGRRGLSVRGVDLLRDAQGPIGSFEIGMSFSTVLEGTKTNTGYDVGVFVDDELMSSVATLIPRPDQERIIGGYQNVESTNWEIIKSLVTPSMMRKLVDVTYKIETVGGISYGMTAVPLLDYKGAPIGVIVAARSFEDYQKQAYESLTRTLGAMLLQMVILVGMVLLIMNAMILRPMGSISDKLAKLAEGADETQGMGKLAKYPNEIGMMARNVEAVEKSMIEQRKVVSEAKEVKTDA